MRVFTAIFIASAIVYAASASPIPQEQQSSGSATWSALREWFSPVTNYFTETFPEQTPSDIADNIADGAGDAQKWVQENAHVQTVVAAVRPYLQTAQESANNLSQTTFSDIYNDVAEGIKNVDQTVGGYINEWNKGS